MLKFFIGIYNNLPVICMWHRCAECKVKKPSKYMCVGNEHQCLSCGTTHGSRIPAVQ